MKRFLDVLTNVFSKSFMSRVRVLTV